MSEPRDKEILLNDILAAAGTDGLREVLLSRTLRQVKRRRAFRQARRMGSALAALAALGFLVWRLGWPGASGPQDSKTPYLLVRTRSLPESGLVETRPLAATRLVVSAPGTNAVIVATGVEERIYREIDDAALLALAAPRAAVLVRLGPHSAELILVPDTPSEQRSPPE